MIEHRKELFFLRILFPTILAIFLFISTIFFVIIPEFENAILEKKKEMIKELTSTAISILTEYDNKVRKGELNLLEAQKRAIQEIKNLRYGKENKDYFWITDMYPKMIMHPYRQDLNGKELKTFKDTKGKNPFELFKRRVQNRGGGYVEYSWQWKDDTKKIVPKLSYVEGFDKWDLIVGTGVYLEDVNAEISNIIGNIIWILTVIISLVGLILFFVVHQSLRIEKTRDSVFKSFKKIQQRYKNLSAASNVQEKKQIIKKDFDFNDIFSSKLKVKDFAMPVVKCNDHERIQHAIFLMKRSGEDLLIISTQDRDVGIVSHFDLFDRVMTEKIDLNKEVSQIMTSPIVTISQNAFIYEAVEMMQRKNIKKLFIRDLEEKVVGVIHSSTLLASIQLNLNTLISSIKNVNSLEELKSYYLISKQIISPYLESGLRAEEISKILSKLTDLITTKIILIVKEEIGEAPVGFAFVALGSEGREEQSLVADQDNALIFEESPNSNSNNVSEYFKKFSELVCTYLNEVGHRYCPANIMSSNPSWCSSINTWEQYFRDWSKLNNREDLFNVSIFFDFRIIYGDFRLTNQLRSSMLKSLKENDIFFLNLSHIVKHWHSPVNMLGHFVSDKVDLPLGTFDIKEMIRPIVNFVRIYALKNNIIEINTYSRIDKLQKQGIFDEPFNKDLRYLLEFLNKIRLNHQTEQFKYNFETNNFVNLERLTKFEKEFLKNGSGFIKNMLSKLDHDF